MKKKIVGTIAGAVLLSSAVSTLPANPINQLTHSHNEAQAKGKVYAKQKLSPSETKQLAKRMKAISGSKGATIVEGIVGVVGGYGGAAAAIASSLARSSQDKAVVQKAAAQGKGVTVTISQGPTPNLDKVTYSIS